MTRQEDTPPASPIALAVEREMRAVFQVHREELRRITQLALEQALATVEASERRVLEAVAEWGHRLAVLELAQKATEGRDIDHERRLSALEAHCFPTEPCGPPPEHAGGE